MSVQPAFEITLGAHGQTVTLRASLRAAVSIDVMPGGFPSTWDQIARQSYSNIRAVILATATDRQDACRYLTAISDMPLCESLPNAQAACLAVLASILPEATEPSEGRSTASQAMPLRDYLQTLYHYATGWLDWTPTETWAASPAEIGTSFEAHVDRLVKMTPGLSGATDQTTANTSNAYTAERLAEIEALGHDPAFDRSAFNRLKAQYPHG